MATGKLQDVIRCYNGDGDVIEWLKKVDLVCQLQGIETTKAGVIPLFLQGPAFAVYEQMGKEAKEDALKIASELTRAFSMD